VPSQVQVSAKPAAREVAPTRPVTPRYPYSVYFASFKEFETVKEALLEYQGKGLSPYWAKVDLGNKRLWFRFFVGYFPAKEEAETFIRDHKLKEATPGITMYANLIGVYGSDEDAEDKKGALVSAGFYPYVIKAPDGKSLVYSGAFDRKEYAEKERGLLASKGFPSTVVERQDKGDITSILGRIFRSDRCGF
jgi:cell division septation protein DedD